MKEDVVSFWRQAFVASACFLSSMSSGFMIAFPGVMNLSLLSPNSTDIKATATQASWLAMSNGLAGLVGFLMVPPIMHYFGRNAAQIVLNVCMATGWITFIFARSLTALLGARMIQGLKMGGYILNVVTISELTHPRRRGYFHAILKVASAVGVLICHVLALVFTWRQIAAVAILPNFLSIAITMFWPESPHFLAKKGRFDECETSYVWLNGPSSKKNKELTALIATQTVILRKKREENTQNSTAIKLFMKFKDKDFQKAFVICTLLVLILEVCGRHYFVSYIIQIMTELFADKSIAIYCSIGADSMIVLALLISCYVIRYFNRRVVLFIFGGFAVTIMLLMSLLVYLKDKFNFLSHIHWLIPSIIIVYCFIINIGIISVCFALIGELFSLHHRELGCFTTGMTIVFLYSVFLKLTPYLMEFAGLSFTYLVYGLFMSLCFVALYFVLPETKDKTLQDIEEDMKGEKGMVVESVSLVEENLNTK